MNKRNVEDISSFNTNPTGNTTTRNMYQTTKRNFKGWIIFLHVK